MNGLNACCLFRSSLSCLLRLPFLRCEELRLRTLFVPALLPVSSRVASARWPMRCTAPTIHCRSLRFGTAARSCCAPWLAQHWGHGYCVGKGTCPVASRQRDPVTARRVAPNSSLEAHEALLTMMEPDHVNETPSYDFTPVAAGGDLCNRLRRLDHLGQELLAERGQAERARQNCGFATRFECRVRVRSGWVTFAARDESGRGRIRTALSGRPEIPIICASAQCWAC